MAVLKKTESLRLSKLKPERSVDPETIRVLREDLGLKIVVLDDDPTGTQTVYKTPVLTGWSADILRKEFLGNHALFYILTNSRSMPEEEARSVNKEIATNLVAASEGKPFLIVSRSDSTLRGHFPLETDTLRENLPHKTDGIILVPAFIEGKRVTLNGTHYIREESALTPVSETEFARDRVFGFQHSYLPSWVEEKSSGRIPASRVAVLALDDIRALSDEHLTQRFMDLEESRILAMDAGAYSDLERAVHALYRAMKNGKHFLLRTAASIVPVLAGQVRIPPMSDFSPPGPGVRQGGLIVVGSYVEQTTRQMQSLLNSGNITSLEVRVTHLLQDKSRKSEITRIRDQLDREIANGGHCMVYTSRREGTQDDLAGDLHVGRTVSDSLVAIVRELSSKPAFLIAKGGITSSDVAVKGLGIKRAMVRGQVIPGVPIWESGSESRFPQMPYVSFPGNVGDDDSLKKVFEILAGLS